MSATTSTPATDARIAQIRGWIDEAERDGVGRSEMILHLSYRDRSGLTRSARVRADEISFAGGVMSFLGVQIAPDAAPSSSLERRSAS